MTPLAWAVAVIAGAASCGGTGALFPFLRRKAVLDRPNERSSHVVPTPRGGGIALVGAVLLGWCALAAGGLLPVRWTAVVAGAAMLMVVSWLDDLRDLSPIWRLLAQIVAVIVGLWVLPVGSMSQGWLPPILDIVVAAVVWLWFVNLFNFMDGIDGIAGSEAASIGAGLALLLLLAPIENPAAAAAAVITAASVGFLVWNWMPARIFMGDVGSVPLGYLLGFLLLGIAARGYWKAALLLPLYFLADATITILRRLLRGERIWRPHREHFYQRAVQRGLTHAAVVKRVIAADLLLIGCAWIAENGGGLAALMAGALVVIGLLVSLARA